MKPAQTVLLALWGLMTLCGAADFSTIKQKLEDLEKLRDSKLIDEAEFKELKAKWLAELSPTSDSAAPITDKKKVTFYCAFDGRAIPNIEEADYLGKSYSESASVGQAVDEILDTVNLARNFVIQASPQAKNNAVALQQGPYRYILYDPDFFRQVKSSTGRNWSLYSILAHELGHHLNGHSLIPGGSRPDLELQADEYSGAVMAQLGASLEDAQAAIKLIASETDGATHPGKPKRLAAIQRGFDKGKNKKIDRKPGPDESATVDETNDRAEPTPSAKKLCRHKMPCQHMGECTHRVACGHSGPCSHQILCQHTMACTHIVPCQHPVITPFGVQPAHAGDVLHPFDTVHQYDTLHQGDAAHEFDLQHPNGDPLHEFDLRHPEGD